VEARVEVKEGRRPFWSKFWRNAAIGTVIVGGVGIAVYYGAVSYCGAAAVSTWIQSAQGTILNTPATVNAFFNALPGMVTAVVHSSMSGISAVPEISKQIAHQAIAWVAEAIIATIAL
jgi:hypothetical protein